NTCAQKQTEQFCGGDACAVIDIHDADVEQIHGNHADDGGEEKDSGALGAHFRCEKFRRTSQSSQIVENVTVVQGDGLAAGIADDQCGQNTYDGDEQEHHQEDSEGLQEVILVQNPEFWHVSPVRTKVGGIRAVITEFGHGIGITPVGLSFFLIYNFFHPVKIV